MNDDEKEREREAERERERAQREAERERYRAEREQQREERHREREERREERRRHREQIRASIGESLGESLRHRIRSEIRSGMSGWTFNMNDLGAGHREFRVASPGSQASEIVEKRFEVSGMPHVRVSNVTGEIDVTVGNGSEVFVRARKRVEGWSEERARRLLENVEIVFEQEGNEIVIEPRMFQQERGWHELFRGGRIAVDFDVRVPRETHLEARTVGGEVSVAGTRGPVELQSVSGEVNVTDVQGPMRLKTVSGDANVSRYAGQIEANSVSGEIEIEQSRVRTPDIVSVSGDIDLDALSVPGGGSEGRIKSVSGDVEVALFDADIEIDYKTLSGDVDVEGPARVEKQGRRDRRVVFGSGAGHLRVKTVSGDLTVRVSRDGTPVETPSADEPVAAAAAPQDEDAGRAEAREILERLARGEIGIEEAAAALDGVKGS